jgi:hypothetical protein
MLLISPQNTRIYRQIYYYTSHNTLHIFALKINFNQLTTQYTNLNPKLMLPSHNTIPKFTPTLILFNPQKINIFNYTFNIIHLTTQYTYFPQN